MARWLMNLGLFVWPPGKTRDELTEVIGAWGLKVYMTVLASRTLRKLDEKV